MKKAGFIIIVFILIIAIVVFVNWPAIKPLFAKQAVTGDSGGNNSGSGGSGNGNAGTPLLDQNKVLRNGIYDSAEVELLQQMLNVIQPSNKIKTDGDFGHKTEAKLMSVAGVTSITLAQATALFNAAKGTTGGYQVSNPNNNPVIDMYNRILRGFQ